MGIPLQLGSMFLSGQIWDYTTLGFGFSVGIFGTVAFMWLPYL